LEHPEVAAITNNLAEVCHLLGRFREAETLYRQAIMILEKALGPDHSDVAMALNNLASVYQDEQRYAEAEPLFQRALSIKERTLGEMHPDVATIANNLGSMYHYQEKYSQAEPLLLRSLKIREKALGPEYLQWPKSSKTWRKHTSNSFDRVKRKRSTGGPWPSWRSDSVPITPISPTR